MDFAYTEQQQALAELSEKIFSDQVTHERLTELESSGEAVVDRDVWTSLADSGLLGTMLPESLGGAGLNLLDVVPLIEAAGRHVAPVPLVPTLVAGLAISTFGTEEQQSSLLPKMAAGEIFLTFAVEEGSDYQPLALATKATDHDGAWRISGAKGNVPYAGLADRIVVSASTGEGGGLFLVDPKTAGASVTELKSTNRQPLGQVALDDAHAEPLANADAESVAWLVNRAAAAISTLAGGVCDGAVQIMANYTSNRKQFGKPIAEFQAVAQRAADAFIDTEMVRLTALHAMHKLAHDQDAANEVDIAKFWAGDGGMRVVHATQHLHGGIGVDVDYPIHRYFLWAKQLEHTLGTPTRRLLALGASIAKGPDLA